MDRIAMPLLNRAYAPGQCQAMIMAMADADERAIAMGEYCYFSGQAEEAVAWVKPYLSHPDFTLRLSACLIYTFANLSRNGIRQTFEVLERLEQAKAAAQQMDPNDPARSLIFCVTEGANVLLHLPRDGSTPPVREWVAQLPPGLRLFTMYIQAHQMYLEGEYGACVGIAGTALALQTEVYPIPSIYLHLVAAMGYMSMKKQQQAREHLLRAWELARPDDLIQPFGEHHGLLGGLLEAAIKREWPDDFRRMIAITYSFSAGWRRVHNPVTGHDVADDLTTTEFAAAMLAARDWTNQEIADHMGISANTVKSHISSALQKLHITQRKELQQFMLK